MLIISRKKIKKKNPADTSEMNYKSKKKTADRPSVRSDDGRVKTGAISSVRRDDEKYGRGNGSRPDTLRVFGRKLLGSENSDKNV